MEDVLLQINVDSYRNAFLQEYETYCNDMSCLFSFALSPDSCGHSRLYLLGHSKISKDYISPTEGGRPSYDGKQSFYSILSSHWEMSWHQLSITTLHCTHLRCIFTIYKMYFSDSVKCISHLRLHCTAPTFVVSSKFTPNSS